jgi:molybdate transport system substrate-binding protein
MKKLLVFFGMGIWLFADMIVGIPGGFKKIFPKIIDAYNTAYHKHVKAIYGPMGYLIYQAKINSISLIMGERSILQNHGFKNFTPIARGHLIVLTTHNYSSLDDLKKINLIALPNPKTTIYGKAAKEAFDKLGIKGPFLQVALMPQGINYLLMGNCDGAVADLTQGVFHKNLHYIKIPQQYYHPIVLGVSILNKNSETESFLHFLQSKKVQSILKSYGL